MSNRKRLWLATFICSFAILPVSGNAAIIYVDNVIGNDRANGLQPDAGAPGDGPVATIGRALQIARGTDAISIANTGIPYSECITLDRPDLAGSERYPFIIEGNGAVLRGAKRLPSDVWRRVGEATYRYQPYRKGHYQLVVNGQVAQEQKFSMPDEPPQSSLQPLQWSARRGFVYLRVEPRKFVDQYEIEAPLFDIGFGLHNARHIVVRNLNIELYRLDGVAVTGNSRDIRLINIRSTGNGRAGLSVSGTSQVQVARLDLAANREAEQLELLKGQITELPEAQVPSKPSSPQ